MSHQDATSPTVKDMKSLFENKEDVDIPRKLSFKKGKRPSHDLVTDNSNVVDELNIRLALKQKPQQPPDVVTTDDVILRGKQQGQGSDETKDDSVRGVRNLVSRTTQLFEKPCDSDNISLPVSESYLRIQGSEETSKVQKIPIQQMDENEGVSFTKARDTIKHFQSADNVLDNETKNIAKVKNCDTKSCVPNKPDIIPRQSVFRRTDDVQITQSRVKPSVRPRKPPRTFANELQSKSHTQSHDATTEVQDCPNSNNAVNSHIKRLQSKLFTSSEPQQIRKPTTESPPVKLAPNIDTQPVKPLTRPGSIHLYEEIDIKPDPRAHSMTLPRRRSSSQKDQRRTQWHVDLSSYEDVNVKSDKIYKRPDNQRSGFLKEPWSPLYHHLEKPTDSSHRPLKRSVSDECLYADINSKGDIYVPSSVTYMDPQDMHSTSPYRPIIHGKCVKDTAVDKFGYSNPNTRGHAVLKSSKSLDMPDHVFHRSLSEKERKKKFRFKELFEPATPTVAKVRMKISQAFSIMRRQFRGPRLQDTDEPHIYDDVAFEDSESTDSESLVDEAEQQRRLIYVRTVREKHYTTVRKLKAFEEKIYPQLFEYAIVVGLERTETLSPYLISKFPPEAPMENTAILQFCFPDIENLQSSYVGNSESYSFVLTDAEGSRQYGYCRRILAPGSGPRLPEVYCIISPLGAFSLYTQVLEEIEKKRMISKEKADEFIQAVYGRPIPSPGKSVVIRTTNEKEEMESLQLMRHEDARLEQITHDVILDCLGTDIIIQVFSLLLLERKIIFIASKLSILSSCIHAMVSLLYPFMWQHTFIPVLPSSLIEICCSPTPYIIGVLSCCYSELLELPMDEDVVIVDLDSHILKSSDDIGTILPKKLQKALVAALDMAKDDLDMASSNLMVPESFLRTFVETVGHYGDYITVQQDGQKIFQKDGFTKAVSSKSIRMFLEWFTETQMFEVFITGHIEDGSSKGLELFEKRIEEYQDEMEAIGTGLKENVRLFGRKVKNLGKQLKRAFKQSSQENAY